MPRAPGSAAPRSSRDWPPATPPASAHGAAADTPAPSTPVAERRHADRDGTTSGSSSTVDDEARRACLALVFLGHRVPIGPRGLRLLTAPTSPSQLLPPGALAAHATKWSTSREQRRVISRERRRARAGGGPDGRRSPRAGARVLAPAACPPLRDRAGPRRRERQDALRALRPQPLLDPAHPRPQAAHLGGQPRHGAPARRHARGRAPRALRRDRRAGRGPGAPRGARRRQAPGAGPHRAGSAAHCRAGDRRSLRRARPARRESGAAHGTPPAPARYVWRRGAARRGPGRHHPRGLWGGLHRPPARATPAGPRPAAAGPGRAPR